MGLGLQLARVATDPLAVMQIEDGYNATTARQLIYVGLSQCVDDRYVPYCGGCTVDAILGAAAFRILGETLLAWKLVPLAFWFAMLVAGASLLDRTASRASAILYCALLAFLPPVAADLALFAWGNHAEGTALSIVVLAVAIPSPRAGARQQNVRAILAGLLLGGVLWFFLGTLVLMPAVFVALAFHVTGRQRLVVFGLLVCCSTLGFGLLQLVSPIPVGEAIYGASPLEHVHRTVDPDKIRDLYPFNMGFLLAGESWPRVYGAGLVALPAVGVMALFGRRPRSSRSLRLAVYPLTALVLYVAAYLLTSFDVTVDRSRAAISSAYEIRYFAPIAYLLPLLVASIGGALMESGVRGKAVVAALATCLLLPAVGRVQSLSQGRTVPDAFVRRPYDYEFYMAHHFNFSSTRFQRGHVVWTSSDPWTRWTSSVLQAAAAIKRQGHRAVLQGVETAEDAYVLGWARGVTSSVAERTCADALTGAQYLEAAPMIDAYEMGLARGMAQSIHDLGLDVHPLEDPAARPCAVVAAARIFAMASYHGDADLKIQGNADRRIRTVLDLSLEEEQPELAYWFGSGLRGRVPCDDLLARAAKIGAQDSFVDELEAGCERGWLLAHSDAIVPGEDLVGAQPTR